MHLSDPLSIYCKLMFHPVPLYWMVLDVLIKRVVRLKTWTFCLAAVHYSRKLGTRFCIIHFLLIEASRWIIKQIHQSYAVGCSILFLKGILQTQLLYAMNLGVWVLLS